MSLARLEAPDALTALDVGAFESPLLSRFDWIPTLVATDMQSRPQAAGVEAHQGHHFHPRRLHASSI